jgi:mannose-6-phosphate isomerase-like protein (cupin superfamily)
MTSGSSLRPTTQLASPAILPPVKLLTQIEQATTSQWFIDELASAALDASGRRGQTALVERSAPEGAMPPLHTRNEAEAYRVLEGEVMFFIDGDEVPAGPGDVVVAGSGAERTFRVDTEDARWLVLTRVSSLEIFLDFNRAVTQPLSVPVSGWPSAEEEAALASIGAVNGIELLGPPGVLPGGRKHPVAPR